MCKIKFPINLTQNIWCRFCTRAILQTHMENPMKTSRISFTFFSMLCALPALANFEYAPNKTMGHIVREKEVYISLSEKETDDMISVLEAIGIEKKTIKDGYPDTPRFKWEYRNIICGETVDIRTSRSCGIRLPIPKD